MISVNIIRPNKANFFFKLSDDSFDYAYLDIFKCLIMLHQPGSPDSLVAVLIAHIQVGAVAWERDRQVLEE